MKQFISFVRKEFLHIFRDRKTVVILLGMPIVQIIIFGFALTNEVKNAHIAVLDQSQDAASLSLVNELDASRYFEITNRLHSVASVEAAFRKGEVKMAVVIPAGFGADLKHLNQAQIQQSEQN